MESVEKPKYPLFAKTNILDYNIVQRLLLLCYKLKKWLLWFNINYKLQRNLKIENTSDIKQIYRYISLHSFNSISNFDYDDELFYI